MVINEDTSDIFKFAYLYKILEHILHLICIGLMIDLHYLHTIYSMSNTGYIHPKPFLCGAEQSQPPRVLRNLKTSYEDTQARKWNGKTFVFANNKDSRARLIAV